MRIVKIMFVDCVITLVKVVLDLLPIIVHLVKISLIYNTKIILAFNPEAVAKDISNKIIIGSVKIA